MSVYQKPLRYRPADLPGGAPMFLMPENAVAKHDERCVTYAWLGSRPLFGEVYRGLLPAYSRNMPMDSGAMIGTFVRHECYEQNHQNFLWTRSHPSASPCSRKVWESEKYLKQLVGKMQQDFH